jgi:recombination protein RecA
MANQGLSELQAVLGKNAGTVSVHVDEDKKTALNTKSEKFKALELVAKGLNKQFGITQSVVRYDPKKAPVLLPSIPTGVYSVDYDLIGTGGVPRGRIIEIFGPQSSGKTTEALEIIAAEQRNTDNLAVYVDAEHALDMKYAAQLGVRTDELLISQPDNGEQALEIVEALVDSGAVSVIVVDSVAALVPRAELEGAMGDSHMGLQARLLSQAMRKLIGKVAKSGVVLIFINQIREKIGVMFGSPETTTGGRALQFYASVRLDVRKTGWIKSGDVIIGHKLKLKAVKNKVGMPHREVEVDLIYGRGVDRDKDFVEYAVRAGAIQQSGAWYSFGEERIGQGLTNVVARVVVEPDLRKKIEAEVTKAQAAQREADEKQ